MPMPWKERTAMSERQRFIAEVLAQERSVSAICRSFGISRKTGYKWMERARNGESLNERSRAPHHRPHKTPPETERLVLDLRDQHPAWGARKLCRVLQNQGVENVPCKSTVDNILRRNNRIDPEASEAATPYKRFEHSRPNDLWQMDHKGDFEMLDGNRCFPLTILDDHSRFSLCLEACGDRTFETFRPVFTRVLEEYGLPRAILSDNGKPWGDNQGGITQFDVWMMRLGILPIHGRPLHPQTQGKDERFHRTLNQELLKRRPMKDLQDAQSSFSPWREMYNFERPHNALHLEVPAAHYKPSKRSLADADRPVEYDSGAVLRKINYKGYISIQQHRYFISDSLIGQYVKLNYISEHVVGLQYGAFEFAQIDTEQRLIVSKKRRRMSPEKV